MRRLALALVLAAALTAAAGCGGGDPQTSTLGPAAPAPALAGTQVIRAWADALRGGHVLRAARYFALPSVVANGTAPLRLATRTQAVAFNRALPCGAMFLRAVARRGYVFASFRLTDRAGIGAQRPCPGKGATAAVAFRIAGGRIREWRRVAGLPRGAPAPPRRRAPAGPSHAV